MGIDVGVHYSTTTRTYRRVGKGVAVGDLVHAMGLAMTFEAAVCERSWSSNLHRGNIIG